MISKTEVSDIQILNVDPSTCKRWKFADRIEADFFKIEELAEDILKNGQINHFHLRDESLIFATRSRLSS